MCRRSPHLGGITVRVSPSSPSSCGGRCGRLRWWTGHSGRVPALPAVGQALRTTRDRSADRPLRGPAADRAGSPELGFDGRLRFRPIRRAVARRRGEELRFGRSRPLHHPSCRVLVDLLFPVPVVSAPRLHSWSGGADHPYPASSLSRIGPMRRPASWRSVPSGGPPMPEIAHHANRRRRPEFPGSRRMNVRSRFLRFAFAR